MNVDTQISKPTQTIHRDLPNAWADDRDSKLQSAKRIDWRFLLPDAQLGRVGYSGPQSGALVSALQQFCATLSFIPVPVPATTGPTAQANFERVVLHSASLADVKDVSSLLMPGGYLYWEIDRMAHFSGWRAKGKRKGQVTSRSRWSGNWPLRHFSAYSQVVKQLGFSDIQVNWHRPNFEACLELIPLDEPLALASVFARAAGNLSSQLQMATGRYLMKTGMLARVVPCFSIVACKRASSVAIR